MVVLRSSPSSISIKSRLPHDSYLINAEVTVWFLTRPFFIC
jgi:hypothetical protein